MRDNVSEQYLAKIGFLRGDYIALFMAIVGIVLAFTIKTYNYRCADCGKKFTR